MSNNKVIISGTPLSYKIVILNNNDIEDVIFGGASSKSIKSNIYLAKVTKVEPSLQAAFVDYGQGKSGFLPFSEIHSDYYNASTKPLEEVLKFGSDKGERELSDEDFTEGEDGVVSDLDRIEFNLVEGSGAEKSDLPTKDEKNKDQNKKQLIQNTIQAGQYILVQVFRDERGNKGVSMTTYITIPTKYAVFTPNNKKLHGVSRRIPNQAERTRLRDILREIPISGDAGLVVRTAACGISQDDLRSDYQLTHAEWNALVSSICKEKKIGLVKAAESGIIQSIRDISSPDTKIIVDNDEVSNLILQSAAKTGVRPDFVMVHRGNVGLFEHFGITAKINNLYKDRVELKSGGYLVINYTEALVAIDVNSGRSVNEKNIEGTALKTNLEAVEEVARQLRLRDIGGLVIIDFIDMEEIENRKQIELKMKEVLSLKDRARVQFTAISPFGLMEISRQRLRTGFIESSTVKCSHCSGTGRMFSVEMVLDEVYNAVHSILATQSRELKGIRVEISEQVSSRLKNYNLDAINALGSIPISFSVRGDIKSDNFIILTTKIDSDEEIQAIKFNGLSKFDTPEGGFRGWVKDKNPEPAVNNKSSRSNKVSNNSESMRSKLTSLIGGILSKFKREKKDMRKQPQKKYSTDDRFRHKHSGSAQGSAGRKRGKNVRRRK